MSKFVSNAAPITIIGGGPFRNDVLDLALRHAPKVVALDSGGDSALEAGVTPDAILGDLDSLSADNCAKMSDRVRALPDQDFPDFEKTLGQISAPSALALGVWGGRIDHDLATLTAVVKADLPVLILNEESILLHALPRLKLQLAPHSVVSLYPLRAMRVASTGLKWATDGLTLDPFGRIGTSNETETGDVTIEPECRGLFVILPLSQLGAAMQAVAQGTRWPQMG